MSNPLADYITVKQFAELHGYTPRRVQQWIEQDRITGAIRGPAGTSYIPKNASPPELKPGGNPAFMKPKAAKRKRKPKAEKDLRQS